MSDARHLVDAEARRIAIADIMRNCFVEAGAGSGKTRCLVERVLTLLEAGTPTESIAVITFTRKAAGELRDRIRMMVSERLQGGHGGASLQTANATLDQMPIETIHGFCRRLLLRYTLEAGLPAGLTVMNSVDEQAAQEADARDFAEAAPPCARDSMLELLRAGVSVAQLNGLYRSLWFQPSDIPVAETLDTAVVGWWLADLQRLAHDCVDLSTDKYVRLVQKFTRDVETLLHGPFHAKILREMPAWPSQVPGARTDRIKELKDAMKQMRQRWQQDICRVWAAQHLHHIASAMAAHVNASHTLRRSLGVLRQDELLSQTMALLREQPALRDQVRARYRYLLVDEFQDTDREQVDIIARIVSRPDWSQDNALALPDPEPGRLFVVGDYRQAIYGFRGADVTLFEAVREHMTRDLVHLVTNFRSSWQVVNTVNSLFAAFDADRYPSMESIHTPDANADGLAAVFGTSVDGRVAEMRQQEAQSAVRLISGELAAGRRPEDIAVLMRDRSILRAFETELEDAGIAYRVESQSLLCATQEYRDIRNLLAAIAYPGDETATVAALMGPACGCTLREMQAWRRSGGHWSLQIEPLDGDTCRVAASLRLLREWRHMSHQLSVPALVAQLIADAGLMEGTVAHRDARESWRRIKLLQQMAQEWSGTGGLPGFVRWLDDLTERSIRQDETVTPDLGMPAVRLLTVHAAKGLEFDTVVVVGFAGKGARALYPVLARHGRAMAWCPGICRTAKNEGCAGCPARQVQLSQREAEDAEGLRLLYVACTRARTRLYLSIWRLAAKSVQPSLIERVADAWQTAGLERIEPPDLCPAPQDAGRPYEDGLSLPDWLSQRRIAFHAGRLMVVTPSRLSHTEWPMDDSGSPEWEPEMHPVDEVRLTADQRRALQRGHAVHRTLATVSFPDGGDLVERAAIAARDAGLGDDPETLRLASILLCGVRDLCVNASWRREVYLGLPLGETALMEGYADLVIDRPEGLVVVDYKTDFLPTEAAVRQRAFDYKPQLACYAHALRQVTGRPVICGYVVFALNGKPLPVRLDGLEQVWTELQTVGFTAPRSGSDSL